MGYIQSYMTDPQQADEFTKSVYVSRDLRLAHPLFLAIWPKLKEAYGLETGMELNISCTYRSLKAQNDLFNKGRTTPPIGKEFVVTHNDGYNSISRHNVFPSEAIDVFPCYAGKPVWNESAYIPLGKISKDLGLYWGGYGLGPNKKFIDRPHLEIVT